MECGVHSDATVDLICQRVRDEGQRINLCDAVWGLSKPTPLNGEQWAVGRMRCECDAVAANLSAFKDDVFHEGRIPDTFDAGAPTEVADLHIDVDQHQPTFHTLAFFYPRPTPGTLAVMDNCGFHSCPGARKATDDFMTSKPQQLAPFPNGQTILYLAPLNRT